MARGRWGPRITDRVLTGAERSRRQRAKHPDRRAAWKLGVSEAFIAELRKRFPVCEVCSRPSMRRNRRLHIDHDHQTGAIRGVLCGDCNNALGYIRDDPALLRALADYIEARRIKIHIGGS